VGVGQQFYLTRWLTLRADYRLMMYKETIVQRIDGSAASPLGTPVLRQALQDHYILVEFAPRYLIIYLPKKMAEFSF
jgi:hypothetical protein